MEIHKMSAPDWQYHEPDHPGADFDAPPGTEITAPADGLILMDVGYEGLDWQVDEYSRARAANALAATVQSRMARAMVSRVMERAMIR
jgi:hypothetical protein